MTNKYTIYAIRTTIATFLLMLVGLFGAYTIYLHNSHPEYFICDVDIDATGEISKPTKISDGFFSYKYDNIPSCKDGVFAQTIPYYGKVLKFETKLGLLFLFVALCLYWTSFFRFRR